MSDALCMLSSEENPFLKWVDELLEEKVKERTAKDLRRTERGELVRYLKNRALSHYSTLQLSHPSVQGVLEIHSDSAVTAIRRGLFGRRVLVVDEESLVNGVGQSAWLTPILEAALAQLGKPEDVRVNVRVNDFLS